MITEERLLPNYDKLEVALRSIGYTFEAAVADIIDNSIDANANRVLVRLITRPDGFLDLAIWDDGDAMDEATLKEAMRFGADVSKEIKRLGKFGLGLKLASLSQAKDLRVISSKEGSLSGRGWLEDAIASGFACTVFGQEECKRIVSQTIPDRHSKAAGTLVSWSRLYRVGQNHTNLEEHAQKLMRRLENHLSLAFHRFLSGRPRRVVIEIDIFEQKTKKAGIPMKLDALDPFGYPESGHKDFPIQLLLEDGYSDRLAIKAHIWPPNSDDAAYKLPGGANNRQGFYFYRNDRLIQGGGWNGIRETEPHSSLARLEIDMASNFDVDVSLDVKKVEIQLPPALVRSIQKAKSASGIDFKKYLSIADDTYRTRTVTQSELPLIPSLGLPAELRDFLHKELRIKATAKHRVLKIQWEHLPDDAFFEIDRDQGYLYINKAYRRALLHGLPGSSADIPVVKCLLFLVLEDMLSSERTGSRMRERIEQINRILAEAVKYERPSE
jgi:hypothetical protein